MNARLCITGLLFLLATVARTLAALENEPARRDNLDRLRNALDAYGRRYEGGKPAHLWELLDENLLDGPDALVRPMPGAVAPPPIEFDAQGDYTMEPLGDNAELIVREKVPWVGEKEVLAVLKDGTIQALPAPATPLPVTAPVRAAPTPAPLVSLPDQPDAGSAAPSATAAGATEPVVSALPPPESFPATPASSITPELRVIGSPRAGEGVVVAFENLPTSGDPWVGLYTPGVGNQQQLARQSTDQRPAGQLHFGALPPGPYEVRAYLSDGYTLLRHQSFSVGEAATGAAGVAVTSVSREDGATTAMSAELAALLAQAKAMIAGAANSSGTSPPPAVSKTLVAPTPTPAPPIVPAPATVGLGNRVAAQRRLAEANAAYAGGRTAQAKSLYLEAVQADPRSTDALLALGRCDNALGDLDGAIAAYETLLRVAPAWPNLRTWIAELCLAKREWVKAQRLLEEELRAQPNSSWALSWFGSLQVETGHQPDAQRTFARAAALDPQTAANRNRNGSMLLAQNQPRRAAVDFAAAIMLNPNGADAYFQLAECYARLGQFQGAIQYYERYLRFDATSARAARARTEIARLRGIRR